jgi:hypothetical protein
VVAHVTERLSVSKRRVKKFDVDRFNLRKLNDVKLRVKILKTFANLENLNDNVDINRTWESIRENIKASANESLGY